MVTSQAEKLGQLLSEAEDSAGRLPVLRKLARLRGEAKVAAPAVIPCLEAEDEAVVQLACRILIDCPGALTDEAQSSLLEIAGRDSLSIKLRADASYALSRAHKPALALESRAREVLLAAPRQLTMALGTFLASVSLSGLDTVLDLFPTSPAAMADSLYNLGPALPKRRARIEELIRHKKPPVRIKAIGLISRMGAACGPSLPVLCNVLTNDREKDEVRDAAVHACLDLRRHARTPQVARALVHLVQASTLPTVHQFYATYFMHRALEEQGPPMIDLLQPLADHPDAHVRSAVVGVITAIRGRMTDGSFEESNTLDEELESLLSQSGQDREEFLDAFGGGPQYLEESPEPTMTPEPTPTVGQSEPEDPDSDGEWDISEEDSEDGDEQIKTVLIAAGDEEAASLILGGLLDSDQQVRAQSAGSLKEYIPGRVKHKGIADRLLELVRVTTHEAELGLYVESLACLPADMPGVMEALRGALTHPRERIRWSGCHSATSFGPGAAPIIPELLVLAEHRLGGEDLEYPGWTFRFDPRRDALKALKSINHSTPESIEVLHRIATTSPESELEDGWGRWMLAVELLVRWNGPIADVCALIVRLLDSSEARIRNYAADVCGERGYIDSPWKPMPELGAALAARLRVERSKNVRRSIIRAIRVHGPHAGDAIPKLVDLSAKGDCEAAVTLLTLQPDHPKGIGTLLDHLKNERDVFAVEMVASFPAALKAGESLLRELMVSDPQRGSLSVRIALTLEQNGLGDGKVRELLDRAAQPGNPLRLPSWQTAEIRRFKKTGKK